MAVDKRKILENARKLAQKGSKDKALKEYDKLVKLDPKDAKLRLEIGDAYRRWGQVEEAISTYQKVADQYMREGFDARAVAVLKQILNLDPDRHSAYEPLAELYERMGLTAEAISALQTAADGFHKQGKKREALELLRKMATIDPSNTTSRIKVAELLRQEKLNAEAVAEYEQAAAELERQGDFDAAGNVYRRLLELEPKRDGALGAFGRNLLRRGKGAEAESIARRAIAANAEEPQHYELLADAFRAQNRADLLPQAYEPLADLYQRRGEGERAREITQRFLPLKEFTADSAVGETFDAGDPMMRGDVPHPENARGLEAADDSPFETDGFGDDDLGADLELDEPLATSQPEIELTRVTGGSAALPPESDEVVLEQPEGDPDQLLAEASVYLRYGKSDKAISHLEAILIQAPDHRGALEKLGEAFAERGDRTRAVERWTRAFGLARVEGATEVAKVLRDRIQAIDPVAAAALADPAPAAAPRAQAAEPKARPAPPAAKAAPVPPPKARAAAPAAEEPDLEIAGDDEDDDLEVDVDLSEVESDLDVDVDVDVEEGADPASSAEPGVSLQDAASDTGVEGASLSTASTQQILEDLEEADFYLEQGLLDEAEGLFKRVLAIAPNHPRALVRLGELAAARGSDPGAAAGPAAGSAAGRSATAGATPVAAAVPAAAKAAPVPRKEIEEPEALGDISIDDAVEERAPGLADAADEEVAAALELDGTAELPESEPEPGEDTPFAPAVSVPDVPAKPAAAPATRSRPAPPPVAVAAAAAPPSVAAEAAAAPSVAAAESGDYDLAAELSDAFDDPNESSSSSSGSQDVDFETVFAAFKRGVSETLDEGDYEAHYDLGIAYKEMGLFDDAIAEFHIAMGNAARETECVHLIGLCCIDSGKPAMAVDSLERLLRKPGLAKDQTLVLRFDLGRAYAASGRSDAARSAFEAVMAQDPKFQDVAAQLAALDAPKPAARAGSEGFESFDDMFDGISEEAEDEKPEVSAGESFEDLFDGDEDASASEASSEAEELEPPPPPKRRPEPAAPAPRRSDPSPAPAQKRKKKISFL